MRMGLSPHGSLSVSSTTAKEHGAYSWEAKVFAFEMLILNANVAPSETAMGAFGSSRRRQFNRNESVV